MGAHSPAVNVQSRKELRSFLFSLYHLRVKAPLPRKSVALSRALAQGAHKDAPEPHPCESTLSGGVQTEYGLLCCRTFILWSVARVRVSLKS